MRDLLIALYGSRWNERCARVYGRTERAVRFWVERDRLPPDVYRRMVEHIQRPRRLQHMRERMEREVEEEMRYRAEVQAWALRWLRLMKDGGC